MNTQLSGAERSEEVMRLYLVEVLGRRRFELIPEFTAEDMIDHTQADRGPAALDAHARGFCQNIPDVAIEVEQIIATEDSAVGIWRWEGTPIQPMAMSATGNPVYPRHVASVFHFRNGLLIEYEPFVGAVDVRAQITAPAKG